MCNSEPSRADPWKTSQTISNTSVCVGFNSVIARAANGYWTMSQRELKLTHPMTMPTKVMRRLTTNARGYPAGSSDIVAYSVGACKEHRLSDISMMSSYFPSPMHT